jgi:hypothetical protein
MSANTNGSNKDKTSKDVKKCSTCGSTATYKDKNKWGEFEHWRGTPERRMCGRCYARANWKERLVPLNAKCYQCGSDKTTLSKYGTPNWIRMERDYQCRSCYTRQRNNSRDYSSVEYHANLKRGIRRALDSGTIFGRSQYSLNETVFDSVTEESAYWIGVLLTDGSVYSEKTGNPRISLTLKKEDHELLVKFVRFLGCSNPILLKKTLLRGRVIIQYTLRFSSKHIAEALAKFGVIPKKSLIAKVIGLENDRHFWRGVMDGDGCFVNRNGHDGDKIILVGSHDLLYQFEKFIKKNISGAVIRIKQDGKYWRLYVYSNTARMLAKLLYGNCLVALDRKLAKARLMFPVYS